MEKFDFVCPIGFDKLHGVGTTLDGLLEVLDENNVSKAVLFPIGEGFIHRFKEQNRELYRISSENSMFNFFCTVNPWFGKDALRELNLCFSELKASGVCFDTSRQGLYIDSPMIFPFIEEAGKFRKPVYFYTGTPLFALPMNLANLASKFPNVTFIMGTMGASDYWGDVIPSKRLSPNIYIETSVNLNVPAVLKGFIEEFGDDCILFGSNYPFTDYKLEYKKIERAGLTEESLQKIFYLNAARLLGIEL